MKYQIDSTGPAAYLQLYQQLRQDITAGFFHYGDKLPSKRLLATETGTSVITVQHAYDILCDEGYVEAQQRRGYFVRYRQESFLPLQHFQPINLPPTHAYQHSQEEFPFSVIAKTMRIVISKYAERLLLKSPNLGIPELRQALASYLGRSRNIRVAPRQIIIGSGAEYLYGLIVQLLGHQRIFAVEKPSYQQISSIYEANGVSCDHLQMGQEGILTQELQRTAATVLHITPFHSFPSGVTATASKRMEYIAWAQARQGILIEDDFDSEFTVSTKYEDTVFSLEPSHSVIYVNTFTKTIAPSMRVGYMVLPISLVPSYLEKVGFYSCTVPVFEQYLLAELLNNGAFERHINRIRRQRRQNSKTTL